MFFLKNSNYKIILNDRLKESTRMEKFESCQTIKWLFFLS